MYYIFSESFVEETVISPWIDVYFLAKNYSAIDVWINFWDSHSVLLTHMCIFVPDWPVLIITIWKYIKSGIVMAQSS